MIGRARTVAGLFIALAGATTAGAGYLNFEVSHVHPIDLTPSGNRLLVVNTPDARLEVFTVSGGQLEPERSIAVGLEPVTVVSRNDAEAWVVNHLSDSISIVDLDDGVVTQTLYAGDEPTDVAFAQGRAFVSVSSEDAVKVFTLSNLNAPAVVVPLFGRDVRALAVSNDGQRVYAVVQRSGNQTTIVNAGIIAENSADLDGVRLAVLGLSNMTCPSPGPPPYPPLPSGIVRNPALTDPVNGVPEVGLIVKWNETAGQWLDEADQDWTHCLPYRLPDDDLFVIDATNLATTTVRHLGTALFEVSVRPDPDQTAPFDDLIYVPNTDSRNFVRFEHPLGVQGHVVDNRISVVNPSGGNSVTVIDLNTHINRGSDPATNLAERLASISQPGMMVWRADGSEAYLTAIGSRKLFRVDGSCLSGSCVFGTDRSVPDAVEVGEGPTGVALLESGIPADERLYVLNRISHSIAVVQASTLTKLNEVPLHDPSSDNTKQGRRFLYDAIDTSGHGDAACSSCHLSGDMDGLAWDLGDPTGDFVSYANANDNVRFVAPLGGAPIECPAVPFPAGCASHEGFDPQKGPMTTQSLRGMLEPLHWRGDRATMNDFNQAFVGLMGTADIGPISGKPAGVSAVDMESFRQFALEIPYPPNPFRNVDDTLPDADVQVHGSLFAGNPAQGELIFDTFATDAGQPCQACHTHPFGAGGGTLGGVTPSEPTSSDAAALFNGDQDQSNHSDLKIPHMRNMYEKFGPVWADPGGPIPDATTGFGFTHDGSSPDLFRFLSFVEFTLSPTNNAEQVRDLAAFSFHFPTGTKPAVGRQVTLPQGAPPTGSPADEALLVTLTGLGDLSDSGRHCELVASAVSGGRLRTYRQSGGSWLTDVTGEAPVSLTQLRTAASSPITFMCVPLMSGERLGGNLDEDVVLDGEDCAPAEPESWRDPETVTNLALKKLPLTQLLWDEQASSAGPSLRFELLTGGIDTLTSVGVDSASCLTGEIAAAETQDPRVDPAPGSGHYYLIRAFSPCGTGAMGAGRIALDAVECAP